MSLRKEATLDKELTHILSQVKLLTLISTTIAVIYILKFYRATKSALAHHKPLSKLIAFKLLVFLTFIQKVRPSPSYPTPPHTTQNPKPKKPNPPSPDHLHLRPQLRHPQTHQNPNLQRPNHRPPKPPPRPRSRPNRPPLPLRLPFQTLPQAPQPRDPGSSQGLRPVERNAGDVSGRFLRRQGVGAGT